MTLTEFLLARLAEDADTLEYVMSHLERLDNKPGAISCAGRTVYDVRRVVAELEVKRRIVERHARCGSGVGYCDDGGHGWDEDDPEERGCADLAELALPYADHPGYREEWRL